MDLNENREAHRRFVALCRSGQFIETTGEDWSFETIVAHLIATDRLMTAAVLELLDGRQPALDNRPCLSPTYLSAICAAGGGREGLLALYEGSGEELALVAAALSDELAAKDVPVYFVDDGVVRVEREMPLAPLLSSFHIDGHTEQLSALQR